jgi:hypothetical protein
MKSNRRKPGRADLKVEIVLSLQSYVRREEYEKMNAGQSYLAQERRGDNLTPVPKWKNSLFP